MRPPVIKSVELKPYPHIKRALFLAVSGIAGRAELGATVVLQFEDGLVPATDYTIAARLAEAEAALKSILLRGGDAELNRFCFNMHNCRVTYFLSSPSPEETSKYKIAANIIDQQIACFIDGATITEDKLV